MIIDIESLKEDLKKELIDAHFGTGFGAPLIESFQLDRITDEQIVELALKYGLRLENYQIYDDKKTKLRN